MRRNFVVRHKKTAASSQAMMRLPKYVAVVVASLLTVVALTAFRSRDGSLRREEKRCRSDLSGHEDFSRRFGETIMIDGAKVANAGFVRNPRLFLFSRTL